MGSSSSRDKDDKNTEPGYPGPGHAATKPHKPHGHDSKLLNKLDPRYNADLIEAHKRGQLNVPDSWDSGQEETEAKTKDK